MRLKSDDREKIRNQFHAELRKSLEKRKRDANMRASQSSVLIRSK